MDEHHVVGIDGGRLGRAQRPIGRVGRAVAERCCGIADMDDVPRLARDRVDGNRRRLVGPHDVLVSHHRLLHLVGHVAAAAASHAVGESRKASGVEIAVVVVLERKIPVLEEGHVESGVDAAEPRHDVLSHL